MSEPMATTAYRHLMSEKLDDFLAAQRFLGGPMLPLVDMIKRAFDLQLNFIKTGVRMARPDESAIDSMCLQLSEVITAIIEFRESNRHVEKYFNHLSTISESILALTWIRLPPTISTANFVKDMRDAGDYFGNRVLLEHRSEENHIEWIIKWRGVLFALENYVKEYHTSGFSWGVSKAGFVPIPPPPPPTPAATIARDHPEIGEDRNALLMEINARGADITQHLRPVKGMFTIPAVPIKVPIEEPHASLPRAPKVTPPRFEKEGRRWFLEHQVNEREFKVECFDMSESLMMFKCRDTGVNVVHKMSGITIDSCKKCQIALKDVISCVEVIRCESLALYCNGRVPLINMDKCESVQIFVPKNSEGNEVITTSCSAINICLLEEDGAYVEKPIPEQIRTVVGMGNLHTTVIDKM